MDLKNLLCNNTTTSTANTSTLITDDKNYCSSAPVYMFDYKDTWSSNTSEITDSPQSSPSLSLYSTFSSPKTTYLSTTPIIEQQQQQQQTTTTNNNKNSNTTQTRTPWTSSEDFLLQKGYSQGLSWAMISSTYLPHRSRGCCWGRFKTLQTKMSDHKEWNTPEDQALLLAIKKHDKLFKQAWKAVARDMGNRSWRECDVRASKLSRMVRKQQHQKKLY